MFFIRIRYWLKHYTVRSSPTTTSPTLFFNYIISSFSASTIKLHIQNSNYLRGSHGGRVSYLFNSLFDL